MLCYSLGCSRMAAPLLHDSVWFQQQKYESAEAVYQQKICGTSGKALAGSASASSSSLKSNIVQARKQIQNALKDGPCDSTGGAMDPAVAKRIETLEKENKEMKKKAADMQALVKRLEDRISALEKQGGGSLVAAPAKPPSAPVTSSKDKQDEDDDDFDVFGSQSEGEEDEVKKKRVEEYKAKKSKKPELIAKSSIILEVKPWDDETDLKVMEASVRSVEKDGLLWGASKLVDIAFGLKKLQICCVVEDEKISVEELIEEITETFEDHVQSVDVAAFNKI